MSELPKDMARALRRHHAARLKDARALYWGRQWGASHDYEKLTGRQLGLVLNAPATCSGLCCGNPRKWFGERTVQELRGRQESLEQLLADAPPVGLRRS